MQFKQPTHTHLVGGRGLGGDELLAAELEFLQGFRCDEAALLGGCGNTGRRQASGWRLGAGWGLGPATGIRAAAACLLCQQ
jgi:hypothetical protein